MGITPHQYYSRILKITKAGLVKKENGEYVITALGNVVYEAVSMVGKALNHYWALKAIESLQSSSSAIDSKEHISKLIDTLVNDPQIKKILTQPQSCLPLEQYAEALRIIEFSSSNQFLREKWFKA